MSSRHPPARVTVDRAPVLTLCAAVLAERLGFAHDEALAMRERAAWLDPERIRAAAK